MKKKLAVFGKELLQKRDQNEAFAFIAKEAKEMLGAERCSLFVYKVKENELRSLWADGPEEIVVPFDIGIIGETIRVKKSIIENEPYDDVNFLADVDMQTGYYTKNILATPLFNTEGDVIGVLEFLNKKDGFQGDDLKLLEQLAIHVSHYFRNNILKG